METSIMRAELSAKDIKHLEGKIFKHFDINPRFDRHGKMVSHKSYNSLSDFLGLAYTSSSSWAGLWVCNEEVYLDAQKKYTYVGFGMDKYSFAIALFHDAEENELYIFI